MVAKAKGIDPACTTQVDPRQTAAQELDLLELKLRNAVEPKQILALDQQRNALRVRHQFIGAVLPLSSTPAPALPGLEWRKVSNMGTWILGEASLKPLKAGETRRLPAATFSNEQFLAQLPMAPKGHRWELALASGRAAVPGSPIQFQGPVIATLVKDRWGPSGAAH